MNTKGRIIDRLDQLIQMGEKVVATRRPPPPHVAAADRVDRALFQQWRASSVAFLEATLGPNSLHLKEYASKAEEPFANDAVSGLATLKAAREDIAGGYLERVESLISAQIFSDFIEMAEYLLENDYKDPAASLIGAVLEEGLRKLCDLKGITRKSKEDIASLNKKLADSGVYNRLRQKEIQVWKEVRDNADHGYFEGFKEADVAKMLAGVRTFLSEKV